MNPLGGAKPIYGQFSGTNWRLSNAISWIAGQTKDAEWKPSLMKIAGEVLPKVA